MKEVKFSYMPHLAVHFLFVAIIVLSNSTDVVAQPKDMKQDERYSSIVGHELADFDKTIPILSISELDSDSAKELVQFTSLKHLTVMYSESLLATDIPDLADLTKLTSVTFASCPKIDSSVVRCLRNVATLEELRLMDCSSISGDDFSALPRSVRTIELSSSSRHLKTVSSDTLNYIASIPALRHLVLSGTDVDDEALSVFSKARGIESLILDRCTKIEGSGLKHFSSCKNLAHLSIQYSRLSSQLLKGLCNLSSIERLDLEGSLQFSLDGNAKCPELPNLIWLDISLCSAFDTQSGVTLLNACPKLIELHAIGCREMISDKFIQKVNELSCLEVLRIGVEYKRGSISGVSVECVEDLLRSMPLRNIDLSGFANLSDNMMQLIGASQELSTLSLRSTNLDDSFVESIAKAPQIRALDLAGNSKLTDSSLDHLENAKEMALLIIHDCSGISDERIKSFIEKHPNCEVRFGRIS